MQYAPLKTTDGECVALSEQLIELAAVALEFGAGVKRLAKYFLYVSDVRTNAGLAAQLLMQVRRGRQVIRVYVGLQNPLDLQIVAADVLDNLVCRTHVGGASGVIKIQDRIENGTGLAVRVAHHITEGIGGFIKKMLNDRVAHGSHLWSIRISNLI